MIAKKYTEEEIARCQAQAVAEALALIMAETACFGNSSDERFLNGVAVMRAVVVRHLNLATAQAAAESHRELLERLAPTNEVLWHRAGHDAIPVRIVKMSATRAQIVALDGSPIGWRALTSLSVAE